MQVPNLLDEVPLASVCFSDLTEAIDEETVVFVMGDHGMTRSGDHGGDSKDEVMAGLFVYSKKGLFQKMEVS